MNKIGAIVIFFIGVIMVVAMLPTVAENTELIEHKQSIVNESIDIGGAREQDGNGTLNTSYAFSVVKAPKDSGDWRASSGDVSCSLSGFVLLNATGSALAVTTDYVVDLAEGNFTLEYTAASNQSNAISNQTYASYAYCDAGYGTDGGTRAAAKLIMIMAALALMGYAVYFVMKDTGWA